MSQSEINEAKAHEAATDAHLEKYLRESDQTIADQLAEQYRNVIPADRIRAMRDLPTVCEDREKFERSLKNTGGNLPEDCSGILGFSRGTLEPAHVATDHLEVPLTIAHERVHQLSHPDAPQILGTPLYEGITEDLARKSLGVEPQADLACYPAERNLAHSIGELCGSETVEDAYFLGNAERLKLCLNRSLGDQALEDLRALLERTEPQAIGQAERGK